MTPLIATATAATDTDVATTDMTVGAVTDPDANSISRDNATISTIVAALRIYLCCDPYNTDRIVPAYDIKEEKANALTEVRHSRRLHEVLLALHHSSSKYTSCHRPTSKVAGTGKR